MVLTGDRIKADAAKGFGLVNTGVVPADIDGTALCFGK